MPRVMINGVVWCKAEDNILKAAVASYGQNQWDRIASLFTGKTAKQCKARWESGLNPEIKKNEWSRQEDEKLLYLKKLMPHEMQTIAMMIGRSVDQCYSRYHDLWFEKLNKFNKYSLNYTRNFKSRRIGINSRIEIARLAPINREYSESDLMLSQAHARLANAQCKKTKRFVREKQMAVERRLKHRQHAIDKIKNMRARRVIYDSESSYEEESIELLSDSSTQYENPLTENFSRLLDAHLEGARNKENEELQSIKRRREIDLPNGLQDDDPTLQKRSKVLVLPVPQYSCTTLHTFHDVEFKSGFELKSH